MIHKVVLVMFSLVLWNSQSVESSRQDIPNLIVILVDGFRWDYTKIHKGKGLPGFDHMQSMGVSAQYLKPIFPPNSLPNWHTIVTGLYPESHGIVSNYMYDPTHNIKFNHNDAESTSDSSWWGEVEPLWITTTKNNIDTALFYWSRCDIAFDGILPKYCIPYIHEGEQPYHFMKQLHQALDMLQEDKYKFVMLYTSEVDAQGHYYGPESSEVAASVKEVDTVLQGLWESLEKRKMQNTTNIVVLSDHGMANTALGNFEYIDISSCIDQRHIAAATEYGSYMNLRTYPGHAKQVVELLKTCQDVKDKVDVYLKEELHERYHYRNHRLIHEIVIIAKQGYFIRAMSGTFSIPEQMPAYVGNHGFDDTFDHNPNMRGILYAIGPSFTKGVEAGTIEQVDVYGLLCYVLCLTSCHANNGTLSNIDVFFNSSKTCSVPTSGDFVMWIVLSVFPLFVIASMSVLRRYGFV